MTSGAELLDAVRQGDAGRAREILAADPGAARERGAGQPSALLMAWYTGNEALAALLAEHAVPDAFEAAAAGDVARLDAIVRDDAGALARHSGDGWTPLHLAAFFGRRAAAERLLRAGASVTTRSTNSTANTALHAAIAGRGDEGTIFLLLDHGSDPNARGGGGYTPLHLAASRGAMPVIARLRALGADPRPLTDDGRTAAALARERGFPDAAERLER